MKLGVYVRCLKRCIAREVYQTFSLSLHKPSISVS